MWASSLFLIAEFGPWTWEAARSVPIGGYLKLIPEEILVRYQNAGAFTPSSYSHEKTTNSFLCSQSQRTGNAATAATILGVGRIRLQDERKSAISRVFRR